MHPVEMVQGFLIDLWHLPVFFKLVLLLMVGAAGWQWWKKRQQTQLIATSANWPVYRGQVVWAQVSDRKREGKNSPSFWEGILTYGYTVPGHELEVGEFRKHFYDEEQANEWARALRDMSVDVRVDPDNPKRSVWQETNVHYEPAVLRTPETDSGLWGMLTLVVLCFSCLGAAVAAWIQLASLIGKPVISMGGNSREFFGMHVGAMVCSVASPLVVSKGSLSGFKSQKDLFESGSVGARAVQVLGIYYGVIFIYGFVRSTAHTGEPAGWPVLMFSAVWLLFYATAAITCWKGIQERTAS